jgi:hypothetical protein
MRAVSLSDKQVISLLNRYFVNVFVSNEDFRDNGSATPDERAQLRRIFSEGYAAKLPVGTVHAYVLKPDGHLLDSMNVVQAAQAAPLTAMLERNIQALGTPPGDPVIKPTPPAPPKAAPGAIMLHVVARYLEREGDKLVLSGQGEHHGNWSDNPGEDWVELARPQWSRFVPARGVRVGDTWVVDPGAAAAVWNRLYPPTENNDPATNRIDEQSLRATVVSIRQGIAQARLDGSLKMKHPFYHKDDANYVSATVVGYMGFDVRTKRIRDLSLVTDQATYGDRRRMPFGGAVSLSGPP